MDKCINEGVISTLKTVMDNLIQNKEDHEKRLRTIERILYIGIGGLYVLQGLIFFNR